MKPIINFVHVHYFYLIIKQNGSKHSPPSGNFITCQKFWTTQKVVKLCPEDLEYFAKTYACSSYHENHEPSIGYTYLHSRRQLPLRVRLPNMPLYKLTPSSRHTGRPSLNFPLPEWRICFYWKVTYIRHLTCKRIPQVNTAELNVEWIQKEQKQKMQNNKKKRWGYVHM